MTPYQPELRPIPLTFMDCPDMKEPVYDGGWKVCKYFPALPKCCEFARQLRICPRGFP